VGPLGVNSNTLIFLQFDYLSGVWGRSSVSVVMRCGNVNPARIPRLAGSFEKGRRGRIVAKCGSASNGITALVTITKSTRCGNQNFIRRILLQAKSFFRPECSPTSTHVLKKTSYLRPRFVFRFRFLFLPPNDLPMLFEPPSLLCDKVCSFLT
jgi:hypothetical protein